MRRVTISCLFLRFVLIFMNIVIENSDVLISQKRAYLCLFFTNFVPVFNKISRKPAYYKVFALCPRDRFLVKDQVKVFLVFHLLLLFPWVATQK